MISKLCKYRLQDIREGFKKPRHGNIPLRGGTLSVNFFVRFSGTNHALRGGGVPHFSVKKKSIKNWPKNGVFGQKTPVSAKKFPFLATDRP